MAAAGTIDFLAEENWYRFGLATQQVRARLGCSFGRAEHIVKAAIASGEVNTFPFPEKGIEYINKEDFNDWFDRHYPQSAPAPEPKHAVKNRRFQSDDELVAEAVKGIRGNQWPNANRAAEALASRAQGQSRAAIIDRLGRKISKALRE